MSTRLGNGEFELKNAEIKRSTLDARWTFLQVIEQDRIDVFKRLFRWGNREFLPQGLNGNALTFSALMSVVETSLEPEVAACFIDAPVNNYIEFIYSQAEVLRSVEQQIEEEFSGVPNHLIGAKEDALNRLLQSFDSLRSIPEATALRQSLQGWGNSENLTADWCLDFALSLLHKFKLHVLDQLPLGEPDKISPENLDWVYSEIHSSVELFVMQARSEFNREKLMLESPETQSDLERENEAFEFSWKEFSVSGRWYFLSETRKNFESRMNKEFDTRYKEWTRQDISLNPGTKLRFINKLKSYCQELERRIKPFVSRTRRLNTGDKHFEWLVQYQLDRDKGYNRIAKENGVDKRTVMEAIKQTANIINLPLRPPTPAGRPRKLNQM